MTLENHRMQRHEFRREGLTLSYLDAEGDGQPLIALHAHWLEAVSFVPLAKALAPDWRVIALDQRGHGYSNHAATYTRDDYLADLSAFLKHLYLDNAVFLGNSLGGVNAYQFAARHSEQVRALIIEDIGVEIADDTSFALVWGGMFKTREDLAQCVGPRFIPYLQDSFRQTEEGWKLAFDPKDTVASQKCLNGDHWQDWLATDCPALLIRGADSRVTKAEHIEQMAARRPNTQLRILKGGHVLHMENPSDFEETIRAFLRQL
jgi:pimeloyl-ACP methyl ester carboxylesterase